MAEASSKDKPLMQRTGHNFGPPAPRSKRCVAPTLCKNFGSQNFRGPPFEEEGSKDNLATTKFPRETASPTNIPQFLAPRVVSQTLRGAHAASKFSYPKFSRTKLDEEGSRDTPRIPEMSHNFRSPALRFKRRGAPFFVKISVPKFAQTPFEEEGSEDNLATTKFPGQTANPAHVPQVLAPRVVPPTLRAPQLHKNFRGQNLRGPSWRNKLPKTHREPV